MIIMKEQEKSNIIDAITNIIKNGDKGNKKQGMKGWICPVCGKGLSPYTSSCPCTNTQPLQPQPLQPPVIYTPFEPTCGNQCRNIRYGDY